MPRALAGCASGFHLTIEAMLVWAVGKLKRIVGMKPPALPAEEGSSPPLKTGLRTVFRNLLAESQSALESLLLG